MMFEQPLCDAVVTTQFGKFNKSFHISVARPQCNRRLICFSDLFQCF